MKWIKQCKLALLKNDIKTNHKKRAQLYDLLESYCQAIPSLIDVLNRIRKRKNEDNSIDFILFEEILYKTEYDNYSAIEAMSQIFPEDEVALIEAASIRGEVHKGFARAKVIAQKRSETKSAVAMAVAYPAYILISTTVLIYFIIQKAVPDIMKLQEVEHWPEWTQPLYSMYLIMVEHNNILIFSILAIILIVCISLRLTRSKIRNALDILPPWSIQKKNQGSIFLIALGDLITNGNSLPKAIERLEKSAPPFLKSYIAVMSRKIKNNETISESLDCGLFGKQTMGYLKDFSSLPVFNKKIVEIGERSLSETVSFVKALAVVIGLLGIIGTAGANGYVALSINAIQKNIESTIRN